MATWLEIADKEGDDRSITLTVQQQYLFFILMLLAQRAPALFISDIDDTNSEEINDFIDSCIYAIMNEDIPPPMTAITNEINCWGHEGFLALGGGTILNGIRSTQLHNFISSFSVPANNNTVVWSRWMLAGHYNFSFMYERNTANGIFDVYIVLPDASIQTLIVGQDGRGSLLSNQIIRGDFDLDASGLMEIKFQIVGTSSGSNFQMLMTLLQIWRT